MSKAPRAGGLNTRLEPLLGRKGCVALQRELVRHTAGWATRAAERVWLAYTPPGAERDFDELVPLQVRRFAQSDGDLGRRLRDAVAAIGREYGEMLAVTGTDAPLLDEAHARAAFTALRDEYDACIIPALDGGYTLLALAQASQAPFMLPPDAWGGPNVLDLTLQALLDAGMRVKQLPPVADLDVPDDALRLLADPHCPRAIRQTLSLAVAA
jgi:rSAM/selenodomain-associated transferase 1